MATIKLIIKSADPRDDGKCPVYVQIMQNGKAARIKTKYFVDPLFWDKVKGRVIGGKTGDPNATKKNFSLAEILIDHEKTLIDNDENIRSLDALEIKKFLECAKCDKSTLDEWLQQSDSIHKTIYLWQTQPSSECDCGTTTLHNAPKMILADYSQFARYKRKQTT